MFRYLHYLQYFIFDLPELFAILAKVEFSLIFPLLLKEVFIDVIFALVYGKIYVAGLGFMGLMCYNRNL